MPLALHPDAARLLALVREAGRPPFETLTPEAARAAYSGSRALLQPPPVAVAEVRDVVIPGPGGALALRVYRGIDTLPGGPLPGLLYLHGGGWVLGDLASHDGVCRRLANAAECLVVAVDYRLAPEYPFPAAIDDAEAALAWAVAHAASLGLDPARLAVGGDSAGGNLAAALALLSRDGRAAPLVGQLLLYPVTDFAMDTGSYARITEGLPLTAGTMRWFIDHYAPEAAMRDDVRASPARAASLVGTAPAFVLTVGHDPLVDEGRAYAARLEADGVPVTVLHLPGHLHGFLTMGAIVPAAGDVLDYAGRCLLEWWRPA